MTSHSTVTITYGERVENHVGMQQIGNIYKEGFSVKDLEGALKKFKKEGFTCEMVKLNNLLSKAEKNIAEVAYILIVRQGVRAFVENEDDLFEEQINMDWDKKAFMYGRVVLGIIYVMMMLRKSLIMITKKVG